MEKVKTYSKPEFNLRKELFSRKSQNSTIATTRYQNESGIISSIKLNISCLDP
jgi:hypothetical protein